MFIFLSESRIVADFKSVGGVIFLAQAAGQQVYSACWNLWSQLSLNVLIKCAIILRSKNNGGFEHIEIYFEDKK